MIYILVIIIYVLLIPVYILGFTYAILRGGWLHGIGVANSLMRAFLDHMEKKDKEP
jgi:hypothetical protein